MKCSGCGKPVEDGDEVVEITSGKMNGKRVDNRTRTGILHKDCFSRAVNSPQETMAEIKRLSRQVG